MMPSPIVQSGMMSPVSTQSPLSHQMLSPQQKSQAGMLMMQYTNKFGTSVAICAVFFLTVKLNVQNMRIL